MSRKFFRKTILLSVSFVLLFTALCVPSIVHAISTSADASLSSAKAELLSCFNAAKAAESAGANITDLTAILNDAANLLSRSESAYAESDFESASTLVAQSHGMLSGFVSRAGAEQSSAELQKNNDFLINVVGSVAGTFAVVGASVGLWYYLKRRNGENGLKKVNLQRLKVSFIVVAGVVGLIVVSPALQNALVFPQTEFFTQLYLLDLNHMTQNYPHNVTANANYAVLMGITNDLGSCSYYQVQVKLLNDSQSEPDVFDHTNSNSPSLYTLDFFAANNETLETRFSFSLDYIFRDVQQIVYKNLTVSDGNNTIITQRAENVTVRQVVYNNMKIDDDVLSLNGYSSVWNPVRQEFRGYLVFELWLYNSNTNGFLYHDRFVGLRLNMTEPVFSGN